MNQKLPDKKKTSELFEGVGSSLHHSFIGAVERDKEPKKISACCNAEVATANSGLIGETNYYICTKCHNDCDVIAEPKELDRSFGEIQYGMNKINSKLLENSTLVKPKELDWEDNLKLLINEWCFRLIKFGQIKLPKENSHGFTIFECPELEPFIKSLLTQQRTQIFKDLVEIADKGELEELRREVTIYFKGKDEN